MFFFYSAVIGVMNFKMISNISDFVCNGPFHWLSPKHWFPYLTQYIRLSAVSWFSIAVNSCPIDWSIRELTLRYMYNKRAFRIGIIRPIRIRVNRDSVMSQAIIAPIFDPILAQRFPN